MDGKEWREVDSAELTALLTQYESLRAESLNAIDNRLQLLLLALAALGALLAGALAIEEPAKHYFAVTLLLSFAVPVICSLVLVVWAGEAMRMQRVGRFLANDLEPQINRKLGRLVLTWEQALFRRALPRDEFSGTSAYVVIVFGLAAVFSPIVGVKITGTPFSWFGGEAPLWQLWVPWTLLFLTGAFLILKRRSYVSGTDRRSVFEVSTDETENYVDLSAGAISAANKPHISSGETTPTNIDPS